jgi:uncharacterized protein
MLRTRFSEALKESLRAKRTRELGTIRLILATLKDRDIAARGGGNAEGISDDEILQMLNSMIKQRRESIELYEKGGRDALAQQEKEEIEIIQGFMPEQMDETEVKAAVESAIGEAGAASIKDMGKVMGLLKGKFAGRMDFSKASGIVKQRLS